MTKVMIAPSILSADFANMQTAVDNLSKWQADFVHCDVMDGVFVKNLTFGMPMIKALKRVSKLPLDVHLMIIEPERYIEEFVKAGADILTFHPNSSIDPKATLIKIKGHGIKCGLVFNPDINFEDYLELLSLCDMIVIMGVYAGFGGQKYILDTSDKLKRLRKHLCANGLNPLVEVDGGVTVENGREIVESGATVLVAGASVFSAENPSQVVEYLHTL